MRSARVRHLAILATLSKRLLIDTALASFRITAGNGVGLSFHEPPQVLHYGNNNCVAIMEPGMGFTIEPMINSGGHEIKTLADGWAVVTRDRKLSAQWEHTICVSEVGADILTK